MIGYQPLWKQVDFEAYAEFCAARGYCSPWHPFVGSRYGEPSRPKLAYCGGAAWWGEQQSDCSLSEAKALTDKFVAQDMYSTPFWRLFQRVTKLAYPDVASKEEAAAFSAWTNLSKTGAVGASAPPDSDIELRNLDVAQITRELTILTPDILLCVSGSLMPSVGQAIFNSYEKTELIPKTPSTWLRRTPWGGWLIWTMHPARKSEDWYQAVETDFSAVLLKVNGSTPS